MEEPPSTEQREGIHLLNRFGGLTESETGAALAAMEVVRLREGDLLFRSGDNGDSAYFLICGGIELKGNGADGGEEGLGLLEAGALFGELSLLLEQKWNSTALARSDSSLLRLSKPALDSALLDRESWGIKLLLGISRMIALKLSDTDHKLREMIHEGQGEAPKRPSDKVAELERLRSQLFSQWSF